MPAASREFKSGVVRADSLAGPRTDCIRSKARSNL